MAVTGYLTRSVFARYELLTADDWGAQKTTMYVDTLPTKRAVDF